MTALRGAIIGFGNIAELGHFPTYAASTEVEIVAIVEPSAARQAAAKGLKSDIRPYASLDALFATEKLDFIDICTPPASHAALAHQALAHGCHVLCEKPLSLKLAEYEELAAAVKTSGKTLFTVHNWKYAPIFREAFEIIQSGKIGPVWHVEIFTLRNNVCKGTSEGIPSSAALRSASALPEDWRTDRGIAGGGILVDHGWHAFYLLLNLIQADPQKILAKMLLSPEDPNALEEAVQTLIQFPNADGYIHLTWRAPNRRNSAVIQGQMGTLLIDDDRILVTTHDGKRDEIVFDAALSAGSHHADWFKALLPDFLEEIRDPAKRGQNFREAGWCVALTTAAYASNLRGFKEISIAFPGTPQAAHA
jgi:predicted dehydrogenase